MYLLFEYCKIRLLIFSILLSFFSMCSSPPDPQLIVDKAIEAHGSMAFNNQRVQFDFRDKHYSIYKKDGYFEYTRSFEDSTGTILDILTNDSFVRKINNEEVMLPDSMAQKYSSSVNSVVYFVLLPGGLNDKAVRKKYIGMCAIGKNKYHKIEVTFEKEGGGEDFEDVFVYWFNKENHRMEYFAYEFHVDGGGTRFREIYNPRIIEGILFADHINYKYSSLDTPLAYYDQLFEDDQLTELSRIILKNVVVTGVD